MTLRCETSSDQDSDACGRIFYVAASSLVAMTNAAEAIPSVDTALEFGHQHKQFIANEQSRALGDVGCGLSREQFEFRLQQEAEEL